MGATSGSAEVRHLEPALTKEKGERRKVETGGGGNGWLDAAIAGIRGGRGDCTPYDLRNWRKGYQ